MKISSEEKYSLDEYVFFKLKGYPWWPGHIINIEHLTKKKVFSIVDPYTNTLSKINDIKNIIKFEENIEKVAAKAKGKKYINSIIVAVENYFEGKKMPKKYEKVLKELKGETISDNDKENNDNKENKYIENKKNQEEKGNKKSNKEIKPKEIKVESKNDYMLNKKRKPSANNNNDDLNKRKEGKIKKVENKEINKDKEKESPKGEKKNKKVELEGLAKIKEQIREKEKREQEKIKEQKEKNNSKKNKEEKTEKESDKQIENEEIESQSSTSEKNESNLMIKNYKNYDFYQITKYLKRIAVYLDKNQKEGKSSYFTIEDKKNFINLMDYLNNKEMNDTIQFLKITNIGNYINYINEKTKIKEFKELTQKFLDNNSEKIKLQLFVEKTLDMKDINI